MSEDSIAWVYYINLEQQSIEFDDNTIQQNF